MKYIILLLAIITIMSCKPKPTQSFQNPFQMKNPITDTSKDPFGYEPGRDIFTGHPTAQEQLEQRLKEDEEKIRRLQNQVWQLNTPR